MAVSPGIYNISLQRRADYYVTLQFKDSHRLGIKIEPANTQILQLRTRIALLEPLLSALQTLKLKHFPMKPITTYCLQTQAA
jgi:hypothetical protein